MMGGTHVQIDLISGLVRGVTAGHDVIRPGQSVWTAWHLDWPVIIPAVLVGIFYARGLLRWTERHRVHPWWQTALYYSGLLTIVLSIISPLDSLGTHHFTAHMIQHLLIMFVGVPLVLLGAPTTPVLRGLPRWLRLGVVRTLAGDPVARGAWRLVTQPLVALVAFTVVMIAWHLVPGWYDAAVEDSAVHYLQHATFAGGAFLYWWNIIDPAPLRAPMGYLMRMVYVVASTTAQAVLAALITNATEPLYHAYERARPIFAISVINDQQLGGLMMWIPGQLLDLATIGVLFAVWMSQSERRQDQLDAEDEAARASR